MEKKKIIYSFGHCKYCGKIEALKSGYCTECEKKIGNEGFPDIFENLLGGFGNVR